MITLRSEIWVRIGCDAPECPWSKYVYTEIKSISMARLKKINKKHMRKCLYKADHTQ